ncbi:MAG: glycosidase [Planctomycetes bacterium]|nr:glycosidase [Planctomycetota bacterium]
MPSTPLRVQRLPERLTCDARRTIPRFFWLQGLERTKKIVNRVMDLDDKEVAELLQSVYEGFGWRHPDLEDVLTEHYGEVALRLNLSDEPGPHRKLLIGAYFTMEYAFESTALFNPSMVPAREQNGVAPGAVHFLMSLRAVGEGHVSSIIFRTGTIDKDGGIVIDPVRPHFRRARRIEDARLNKKLFRLKLIEMGAYDALVDQILGPLGEWFTRDELHHSIDSVQRAAEEPASCKQVGDRMIWLARSNYEVRMAPEEGMDQLVLFPISETESHGMEDMRLVRFVDEDGSICYYGTYTAYNGHQILPQIIESHDPGLAQVHTLNGKFAQNKGMALFPRKIDGYYAMIGRADGENLFFLQSDNVHFWNEAKLLQEPKYPWEFVQIGNCGSPIETEAGWLLLTHGVGPMRQYCIGATLLDLKDPTKILGRLAEPLLMPAEDERTGYVPNVVYSCGGMAHNGTLVIPYGISDAATGFATMSLDDLLAALGA